MKREGKHLVFFDEGCPLCQKAVKRILKVDLARIFFFAPLMGKTAQEKLVGKNAALREMNTLVLLENVDTPNQRVWIRGKGALRIFWLIGGFWKLLGVFCFLPVGADLIYRLLAHHRHKFSREPQAFTPEEKIRFLP